MWVTELGIVTLVKPLQPWNAPSPMEVTELGIVTLVKPLQSSNAEERMEETELGMVVDLHPAISVLVAVSIMALQLSRESYFGFPELTIMLVKPLQPRNAL